MTVTHEHALEERPDQPLALRIVGIVRALNKPDVDSCAVEMTVSRQGGVRIVAIGTGAMSR
jgi:hypothetical protein